jgi:hypothetical protein
MEQEVSRIELEYNGMLADGLKEKEQMQVSST